MSSGLNKRQQARNERALQDLIKSVPGNDRCADCSARNPADQMLLGWASWSLGIFLCMRCAALHRKLGTHISKVKSLSMDSWTNEQVENMRQTGNTSSNRKFNPQNTRPSIPIDVDEVDGAMERFIRQKYEHNALSGDSRPSTRNNTGSNSSVEDKPPPLPPKPSKKFGIGFRAASSTLPNRKTDNFSPPISPGIVRFERESSPPRVNKASRVFGSTVNNSQNTGEDMEVKLQTLLEMGFPDEKRNSTVLKGLNGNLDKAVEALVRLGEGQGSRQTSGNQTPAPAPISKNGDIIGITIDRSRPSMVSKNPFDRLDNENPAPAPPVKQELQQQQLQNPTPLYTQHQIRSFSQASSPINSFNPFLPPIPQGQPMQQLDASFQSLQIAQRQPQQLFPNNTGGHGFHNPQAHNPFLQTYTPPPVPQIPNNFQSSILSNSASFNSTNSNPFLRHSQSQNFVSSNPFDQPQQQQQVFNSHSAVAQQPPAMYGSTQQQQQQWSQSWQPQEQQTPFQNTNYSDASPFSGIESQQTFNQSNQSTYSTIQSQAPIMSGSTQSMTPFRKESIMALYNYPHLAPPRATDSAPSTPVEPFGGMGSKHRSVTMPVLGPTSNGTNLISQATPSSGTLNPFGAAATITGPNGTSRHMSNESVDFAGLMNQARSHSPDAFAGLSAKYTH
ncbi:ArfGap-domain-containing protein [Patellaria atrata CBS 101060]|uniref:ArfGap-domain-containing protein n=1 Tax=Patellaria atrata CBS 101060 TaxID=1346257 RepID=A0A9P4VUY6_9PEZI|nr:ArfGap-domain-containing protein [Patellaria atrata CBS 101060]